MTEPRGCLDCFDVASAELDKGADGPGTYVRAHHLASSPEGANTKAKATEK